jgi:hypothetical protein
MSEVMSSVGFVTALAGTRVGTRTSNCVAHDDVAAG